MSPLCHPSAATAVQGHEAQGMIFKPLEMQDRAKLEEFLRAHAPHIAGYSFAELGAWNGVYAYEWTCDGGETLYIRTGSGIYLQPMGAFDAAAQARFISQVKADAAFKDVQGVSCDFLETYADFVKRHFTVDDDRGQANYVYRALDLATLAGKAFAKKRNLIAQARKAYAWTVEPLTPANAHKCLSVLDGIAEEERAQPQETPAAKKDGVPVRAALNNLDALGYRGVVVEANGQPAGFAVYDHLSSDTYIVSFEKALRRYKGMYQIVNNETAKIIAAEGGITINREEDMNIAGLRQAKMSYNPSAMAPSCTLTLKK